MRHQSDGAAPPLRTLTTISFQVTWFSAYISSSLHHIISFPKSETLLSTLFTRHQARQHAREGKRKQTVQEMESGKHTCPKNRQVL